MLLFSTETRSWELRSIYKALLKIPVRKPLEDVRSFTLRPVKAMPCREAFFSPHETLSVGNALGRICGGIDAPCPPCVPLVMPGEAIDAECIDALKYYGIKSICVCK